MVPSRSEPQLVLTPLSLPFGSSSFVALLASYTALCAARDATEAASQAETACAEADHSRPK